MPDKTTQPLHVPPDAGDTVFPLGDTYTTLLSDGMFAEIGSPGRRGAQAPPLSASDVEKLTRVAESYRFTIVAD
jgi:hypothetical protein